MLIIDTELSGLRADLHSVLSIGAVDFRNPDNRFYGECSVWEGAEIQEKALAVNGFTFEEATDPDKQSEAELLASFLDWSQSLPERTLVAQNVALDRLFLETAARRAHLNWNLAHRTVDIHSLCWMHITKAQGTPPVDAEHRRSALNSAAVLRYCGLPTEPDPHNALTGALWHAEVTARLLYDRSFLPEFEQYQIPWLQPDATLVPYGTR